LIINGIREETQGARAPSLLVKENNGFLIIYEAFDSAFLSFSPSLSLFLSPRKGFGV